MKPKVEAYYARHEAALRNGSFIRRVRWSKTEFTLSTFINGDFMGSRDALALEGLTEFEPKAAAKLIPACCR